MGKIKDSTSYLVVIIITNFFILLPIINITNVISQNITLKIIIAGILITIFEILLTNILINIQNNLIIQTELLKKISEQKSEKPVDIMQ